MAKASEVKVGDIVRLNSDKYAINGYFRGIKVNVTYKNGNTINIQQGAYSAIAVTCADVDAGPQSREDIEKEVKEAEVIVAQGKDKLKWMEETSSEVYDEKEFKVWQILGTIENKKTSKIEKARAIAAIVG